MTAYRGVTFDWIGTNGTVFLNNKFYVIPQREGASFQECSERFIDDLLACDAASTDMVSEGG